MSPGPRPCSCSLVVMGASQGPRGRSSCGFTCSDHVPAPALTVTKKSQLPTKDSRCCRLAISRIDPLDVGIPGRQHQAEFNSWASWNVDPPQELRLRSERALI